MISLENVTKKYGPLVAVNDLSYTVNKGEFFALLGPNGAGKTTVVRMLLGFSRPTDGTITIDGLRAGRSESRKKVGYLAELHRIPPYLSGQEYLLRHAAFCGLIGSSAKKAVGEIIERVGMTGQSIPLGSLDLVNALQCLTGELNCWRLRHTDANLLLPIGAHRACRTLACSFRRRRLCQAIEVFFRIKRRHTARAG